ncbi:amidohydrolase family protein [Sarocladium implicatum]|nr:amidohydrolase family protein [Sarocladium implicatum]
MTIIRIANVRRFNCAGVEHCPKITFKASLGNVLSTGTEADEVIDSKIDADATISSLRKSASYGITTVIDLSSSTVHSETMRAASLEVPGLTSYLSAGSGIGSKSNESSSAFHSRAIRGVTTSSEAVDLIAEDSTGLSQTDLVRLIVDIDRLNDSALALAVDASHQRGKLAVAYASQANSYLRAFKGGFDIITPVPNDASLDPAVVARLAKSQVAVIPTLCDQAHALRRADTPRDISQAMTNVKTLHDAGVNICAGTCANQRGSMTMEFGSSLHDELRLLVDAGLSNREALACATHVLAKIFGLRDRGSLEPGQHRADLVLVEGDPSEDITAASRIRRVWIQGIDVLEEGSN